MAGPLQWWRAVLVPLLESGLQPAVAAAGLLGNLASWVVLRRPAARHRLHPGYYSLLASQATHRLHIYGLSQEPSNTSHSVTRLSPLEDVSYEQLGWDSLYLVLAGFHFTGRHLAPRLWRCWLSLLYPLLHTAWQASVATTLWLATHRYQATKQRSRLEVPIRC